MDIKLKNIKYYFKRNVENLLFIVLKFPIQFFFKCKFNTNILVNELNETSKAYILIGNHVVAEDPIVITSFSKKLIRFLASDTNYDTKWKKFFLNLFGCIPFSKNNFDLTAVKKLLLFLKQGYPIGVYPEGGRTWSGETDEIIFSTAKLIKLAKVSVYTSICKGGYLTKPRWSEYYRKGVFEIEITKTIDANDILNMSTNEIFQRIKNSTYHNDYEWQRKKMIPFKGKRRAKYIERVLYLCPKCNTVDSFKSSGNIFYCKKCNSKYEISEYGFIVGNSKYDNVVDWNNWQRKELEILCTNNDITLSSQNIKMQKFYNNKKVYEGFVDITLNNEKLIIKDNNKKIFEEISINTIKALSVTLLDILEFYNNNNKYRMILNPEKNISINLFYNSIILLKRRVVEYAK